MRLPWIIWVALNIITSICIRERLGDLSHTHTHTGRESSVTTKAEMAVSYNTQHILTIQPGIMLPDIYSNVLKSIYSKNLSTYVYSTFIHNCQSLEESKLFSIAEWINKLWYIHTMEYCLAIKRNESAETWCSIEEPWKHYAKWKKEDTKKLRNVLSPLIWNIQYRQICRDNDCLDWGGGGVVSDPWQVWGFC